MPAQPLGPQGASSAGQAPLQPASSKLGGVYPRSYALVIGIDAYKEWPKLGQAVADSIAVRDALSAHGFEVTHKTDLNAQDLRDTLDEFFIAKGADPSAGLFLWFAGHGHTINGEGYLVPTDAANPNNGDVHFRRKALSMRDFGRLMREARAQHVLSVFDSCFAGTVFKTARSGMPPAISAALRYPVRQYISAGDHTQTVADDGNFRRNFVAAIMGQQPMADHDKDGYVTGQELGIFMHNRLLNLSNGQQTPRYGQLAEGDFDRGDFVFRVGAPRSGDGVQTTASTLDPSQSRANVLPQPIRDPLAQMRSTQVFVASPVGAPGDGNLALRQSIVQSLMNQGYEVTDHDKEYAFKIHPTVNVRQTGLLTEEILIRWQVFSPSKVALGVVEERKEIMVGGRNAQWGSAATNSAAYAVKKLTRYLSRPS